MTQFGPSALDLIADGTESGRLKAANADTLRHLATRHKWEHAPEDSVDSWEQDLKLGNGPVVSGTPKSTIQRHISNEHLQKSKEAVPALDFREALALISAEYERAVAQANSLSSENTTLRQRLETQPDEPCGPCQPPDQHAAKVVVKDVPTIVVEEHLGQEDIDVPHRQRHEPQRMDFSRVQSTGGVLRNMSKDKRYEEISERVGHGMIGREVSRISSMWDYALAEGWITWRSPGAASEQESRLYRWVHSATFDSLCALMIVGNGLCIAASTDYGARNAVAAAELPLAFIVLEYMFSAWFVLELLGRLVSEGPCQFWSLFNPQVRWNLFDTIVVGSNVVEIVAASVAHDGGTGDMKLTVLRMLRVMRMARAVRIIRFLRFFKELRMMILSILRAGSTLVWAIVLLSILVFVFSIYLTQNVTVFRLESSNLDVGGQRLLIEKLEKMFGSLLQSAYTLFQSVTGGVSWQEVSDPLIEIHWVNGVLFCFYIFFTIFAMLNIITGIFVDTALRAAANDKDDCIQEQLQQEDSTLKEMQKIFDESDRDKSGYLTFAEFDATLNEPAMRLHLAALGIEVGEAEGIFRLLDMDDSGTVSTAEFLFGCMRMKGHAKSVDLATLMYENKRMIEKWRKFEASVQQEFEVMKSLCVDMKAALRGWNPGIRSDALETRS